MTEPEKKEDNSVTPSKTLRKGGRDIQWEPFWEPQACEPTSFRRKSLKRIGRGERI